MSDGGQGVPVNHGTRIRVAGTDVHRIKVGVVIKDGFLRDALGQQAQDEFHRNSHVADDRLAAEDVGPGGDAFEQVFFRVIGQSSAMLGFRAGVAL